MSEDDIEEFANWCAMLGYNFTLEENKDDIDVTTYGSTTKTYLPIRRSWTLKIAGEEITAARLENVISEGKRAVLGDLHKISA